MEALQTVIKFFQQGGYFMYPIVVMLALGLSIAIERYISLSRARRNNSRTWEQVTPALQAGDYQAALKECEGQDTAVGKVLQAGLERLQTSTERNDVEMSMEETLMESIPQLEKRTHYLATLANVATLMGLLGTIIGLIQAFTAIANVNPSEKADLLSASISVAMNTTAFGLMVAIPLLLLHAILQTKTTTLVDSLEMVVVKFLNALGKQA
ncbi:MAG: MotA/TolQ/ExbB proton channel family protein [Gammaproteobacteria bacterium]|nr:MotA/TolQ/ExbB proton channel family protein [Gammaproteobacteria bacterium]